MQSTQQMSLLSFLGLNDETEGPNYYYLNLENCPLPARYETWPESERLSELPTKISVTDNRFRVFMHSQRPKWAANILGQSENYDQQDCTVRIDEEEYKKLQNTLAFVKQDSQNIDTSPCVWSEVHSLRELLAGIVDVNLELHLVKVAWDSRLGMAIRKNKFIFSIYSTPDDGILTLLHVDVMRLVRGLCTEKCSDSVKNDLRIYDFMLGTLPF